MAVITGDEDTVAGPPLETTAGDAPQMDRGEHRSSIGAGDLIGRYVVLGELGTGGMGVVVVAYDPELDRKVAIKLVRPEVQSASSRERMVREARSMAQLSHSNVVSVFDAGEHEGAIYIAMEFVVGSTLTKRMKESSGWRETLELFVEAGRGLAAAHARGLIHRDFKPDNVMVGDDGRVRVMDFGLARREGGPGPSDAASEALELSDVEVSAVLGDSRDSSITRAGAVMGTPAYMSPEQFEGTVVGEHADQFAFCIALWEGMFGERPYAGDGLWSLGAAVTKGERRAPPAGHRVPRWILTVLERGLARAPGDRWPSMDALLDAIERGRNRRRNRVIALVVAAPLVVIAAGYGLQRAWEARVADLCTDEASETLTWPGRASSLKEGMLSTNLPFSASSYGRVERELDDWRESWTELHGEVCRDERIHRERSPELRDAQRRCLTSSQRSVETLVDVLASGDSTMIVFAVDHATLLSNLDACRDTVALERMPRPDPEDEEVASRAQEKLNDLVVLQLGGRYEEALELGRAALAELQQTDYAAGVAAAKVRLGSLLVGMGHYDEGRRLLEDAYFSGGALGEDDLAAEAARHLAGIGVGPSPHGIEWVRSWVAHATMLHTRLGMSRSMEQAEVDESLAVALATLDDPASLSEEIALIRGARDIRASVVGDDHPTVLVADLNLLAYQAEEDPSRPVTQIREIGEKLRVTLGASHPTLISYHLMLAGIEADRGRTTEALAEADLALAIATEALGPEHPETVGAREIHEELVALTQPPSR